MTFFAAALLLVLAWLSTVVQGGEYCGCYGHGCVGWCDSYCCGTSTLQYCCNSCAYAYPNSICWVPVGTIVAVSVTSGLLVIALIACVCALLLRRPERRLSHEESSAILYPRDTVSVSETGVYTYPASGVVGYGAVPYSLVAGAPPPYSVQPPPLPPPPGPVAAPTAAVPGPSSESFWNDSSSDAPKTS